MFMHKIKPLNVARPTPPPATPAGSLALAASAIRKCATVDTDTDGDGDSGEHPEYVKQRIVIVVN